MKTIKTIIKNKIFRSHVWLDEHDIARFTTVLILVGAPNLFITLADNHNLIFIGLFLWIIAGTLAYSRFKYIEGKTDFDDSIYEIPKVGDQIIMTNNFYFDGGFLKNPPNPTNPSRKPNTILVPKGTEALITKVKGEKCDWDIEMELKSGISGYDYLILGYFESRKYWKTKSDIRNDRLRKIGI